jgi:hypothetical protein
MRIWMVMAVLVLPALVSGCPKKETPAEPESANTSQAASAQPASPGAADKSGAPQKEDEEEDEKGGW